MRGLLVCSTHGGDEKCVQNFGLESQNGRAVRRPKCKWEGNVEVDLKEIR
jgi:hypothetical protein